MKKTFTINISGTIFHIEDDAYERLQNYLISLKNHFGNTDEGNEIIADIESRIAELFTEKMKSDQEVVAIVWVNQVIETMGTPEDFIEAEEETIIEAAKRKKRLYRDPEKRIIGGVCAGLGAYFNIDPLIIRIIMVILALFNGVGLLAYLVLWIAVPKAVTTTQRLEMRGQEVTVSNIEKSIREEVKDVKESYKKLKESETYSKGREKASEAGDVIYNVFRVILKIFVIIIGACLILTGFMGLLTLIPALVIGQSVTGSWPLVWNPDLDFTGFISHFVTPGAFTVGIISFALLAGIPLLIILFIGTKMVFRFKSNNAAIVFGMIALWIAGLVMILVVSASQLQNFRSTSASSETKSVDCLDCKTMYLEMGENQYQDNQFIEYWDFDNYRAVMVNEKEVLLGKPRFDVEKSNTDDFVLVIRKNAKGKTRLSAKESSEEIAYNFTVKDSTLIFDPYFVLGENAKWRNQKVELTLKVPEGKSIFLGKEMIEIIHDIENVSNTWDGDMVGKYWEMKPEGLTLKK